MECSGTVYRELTFFPASETLCVVTVHVGSTVSTVLGEYSMNYMGIMSAIRILLSQGKCRRVVIATGYAPGAIYSVRGQMPQGTGQVPPVALQEPEAGE